MFGKISKDGLIAKLRPHFVTAGPLEIMSVNGKDAKSMSNEDFFDAARSRPVILGLVPQDKDRSSTSRLPLQNLLKQMLTIYCSRDLDGASQPAGAAFTHNF